MIVVTGYASLDYAVRLDRPPEPDRTATVLSRAAEFPRLGGSPAYVAAALAAAGGAKAKPVTWVGDDAEGRRYCAELEKLGVHTKGVRARPGRTPICILAYQPDGGCHCFYHPSLPEPLALDDVQRALVAAADRLCVTIGPERATREALALLRPEATLAWAVKADARAVPPDLAAALAARADIVVSSRGERGFVCEAFAETTARRSQAIRLETRGGEGVAILREGSETVISVERAPAEDTTGAGDTFLGGFLAALRGHDIEQAVECGINAARNLLLNRVELERRSSGHVA